MPYQFSLYNFQDGPRAAAAHEAMARMEADGWAISTASIGYTEMSALWFRAVPEEPAEPEHHCEGCTCAAKATPEEPTEEAPPPE